MRIVLLLACLAAAIYAASDDFNDKLVSGSCASLTTDLRYSSV